MGARTTVRQRRTLVWQATLLFVILVAAASRMLLGATWYGTLGSVYREVLYHSATLGFNYFQFGAVRRGLGGSVAYLLSGNAVVATFALHTLCAILVAATVAWLVYRLRAPLVTGATFAAVLLAIMLRWGEDAGRTDLVVAVLFGATAVASLKGRPVLAALFVAVGLFVHESSFVFGIPLLLALAATSRSERAPTRSYVAAAAVLVVALLLYLGLDSLPHAGRRQIVETIRGRLPIHEHVDWALYFALSGMRGVLTSVCQNRTDPSYWVHPASGSVVIGLTGAAVLGLRWNRTWAWALLAALPGFIFLSIVANDISRWTLLACFNVWLVAVTAAVPEARITSADDRRPWLRLALAVLLVPLVCYRAARIEYRIYAPSPVLEAVVRRLGGPRTPSVEDALERCDPHWSDVIYAP